MLGDVVRKNALNSSFLVLQENITNILHFKRFIRKQDHMPLLHENDVTNAFNQTVFRLQASFDSLNASL